MQINMQSTVVYDASQGYDEDTWDDSALIKAYDRAKESSRCSVMILKSFDKILTFKHSTLSGKPCSVHRGLSRHFFSQICEN